MTTSVMPTLTAAGLTDMLRAGDAATTTTDIDALAAYLNPFLDAQLSIFPLVAGEKIPAVDDWPARECGPEQWNQWATAGYENHTPGTSALGLGLRLGTTVIAADADKPGQVDALQAFLERMGYPANLIPTVQTPGTRSSGGDHHGGGHWYFVLDRPLRVGLSGTLILDIEGNVYRDSDHRSDNTFDLKLTRGFVVMPPTIRTDGMYTASGEVLEVTPQLWEWLDAEADRSAAELAEKRRRRAARGPEEEWQVEWEDANSWSDILTPAGWTETGADNECGCAQWHHPDADSAKSATAHENCHRGTYLELWSTSCPQLGGGTHSKIQTVAALRYSGDVSRAITAAGGPPPKRQTPPVVLDLTELTENTARAEEASRETSSAPGSYDPEEYPEGHPNDPELLHRIFDLNDFTRAIYHAARGTRLFVSPVAKLLMELVTTARMTGPDTRTPYGDGLSLCVALSARSGGGKSVALSQLEAKSLTFARGTGFGGNLADASVPGGKIIPGLASGQSLVDALTEEEILPVPDGAPAGVKPEKCLVLRDPAIVTVAEDELDNLARKSSGGSILTNTILSAWSERPIGDVSRTHGDRTISGDMGHYMVHLLGGIQPARAESLVGRAAAESGLAQRMFFVGLEDPWYADTETGKHFPDKAGVAASALDREGGHYRAPSIPEGVSSLSLPAAAEKAMAIQNAHTAAGDQNPGETHLNRIRIRLACLMALTMGLKEVRPEVWEWSAALMEHRRRTLAFVEAGARTAAQEAADEVAVVNAAARAKADSDGTDKVQELAAALLGKVPAEGIGWGTLKKSVSKGRQRYADDALAALRDAGVVSVVSAGGGRSRVMLTTPAAG